MGDIERIYKKFGDAREFTGACRQEKAYGWAQYKRLEEYCESSYPDASAELLDIANGCITAAADEAFLDGLRFC